MTQPWDERPQLDHTEEQFVRRLAAHYAPKPLTPARRVALDVALWARLRRHARRTLLAPALVTAAVAVLVACLTWSGLFTSLLRQGGPSLSVRALPSTGQWEYELLYPRELTGAVERDDRAMLPDDYRVIAQVFLDQ